MENINWDKIPSIDWDAIGGEIKKRRKLRGLSQEELAQKAGIALSSVRRYESGERQPDEAAISRIARVLECDVRVLLSPKYYSGKVLAHVKVFYSDKGTRLSCKIDSRLYDTLAVFADENKRTLEDEIEDRLYLSVENDIDDYENQKSLEEQNCYTGPGANSQKSEESSEKKPAEPEKPLEGD